MLGAAVGQNAAEDARMERLHAAVEERREAGQLGDLMRLDAVLAQVGARSAGCVDRRAARCKRLQQVWRSFRWRGFCCVREWSLT